LSKEIDDLTKSLASLVKITKELDQKIKEKFNQSLYQISEKFNQCFRMFFGGGRAKLVLKKNVTLPSDENISNNETTIEEKENFLEIEIFAQPPKKRLKNIESLSGGESALTSLALISAIIAINKPPFVILDEVDAALDGTHSFNFAKMLKDLAKKTQFIIITHNPSVIETAQYLYGTTIDQQNTSKLISLKLEES